MFFHNRAMSSPCPTTFADSGRLYKTASNRHLPKETTPDSNKGSSTCHSAHRSLPLPATSICHPPTCTPGCLHPDGFHGCPQRKRRPFPLGSQRWWKRDIQV